MGRKEVSGLEFAGGCVYRKHIPYPSVRSVSKAHTWLYIFLVKRFFFLSHSRIEIKTAPLWINTST